MMDKHLWINVKIGQFTKAVFKAYENTRNDEFPMSEEWVFEYLQREIKRIQEEADELYGNDL